jgi:hypothetical protein
MRKLLVVHYRNEAGTEEAAIDVGGLFKEFWTDLCAIAFDPSYALFRCIQTLRQMLLMGQNTLSFLNSLDAF